MFSQIGPLEILLVLVIVLVIFGPKRLPGLGRQLGGGLREFKDSMTGLIKDDDDDDDEPKAEPKPAAKPALVTASADKPRADVAAANEAVGRPSGD